MKITPAFDKRSPEPSKNYGIHNCEMFMVLKGELGAIIFSMNTGWDLEHVHEELAAKTQLRNWWKKGIAVCYCSPVPMNDDQKDHGRKNCDWLGCTCYGDCGYAMSDEPYRILVEQGSDKVWEWLENYYKQTFGELK